MKSRIQEEMLKVLKDFLALPHSSDAVLDRFTGLPGAERWTGAGGLDYVYIPPRRYSPVLMVAHADVAGDLVHLPELQENSVAIWNHKHVLGADDRAGCAIVWALRHLGHGILIVDGEEYGCCGAQDIMDYHPELREELQNRYQFMVEFDRQGCDEYKCYTVGTDAFRQYIESFTGFHEPDRRSRTDIAVLARDICGVNLSCGYRRQHSPLEYIVKKDWLNTLQIAGEWLSFPDLPRFELT